MSVVRATRILQNAIVRPYVVKASSAVTQYMPVTLSSGEVLDSTTGQDPIGIALMAGAAGETVDVALLTGGAVLPVMVGTAGATAGGYCVVGTTGAIDKTFGGGSTVGYCLGKFLETGTDGQIVGLIAGQYAGVTA